MEGVVAIGGDEREEKRFGVGEFVVSEETRDESEEREGAAGDGGRRVSLKPPEKGEEGGGTRSEGFGREDREKEREI